MDIFHELTKWFLKNELPEPNFSPPPNDAWGDLSSAICLKLAKEQKQSPLDIAKELAQKLDKTKPPFVSTVAVTPPGYINIFLDFKTCAKTALKPAAIKFAKMGGKIIVEHTSVNPNKAAHVGHVRNAALGDTVARLLKRTGHIVEVQNYIDDTGIQVADVVFATEFFKAKKNKNKRIDYWAWDIYTQIQSELNNPGLKHQRDEILHLIEKRDPRWGRKALNLAKKIVDAQIKTFVRLGIQYDALIWESSLIEQGLLQKTLAVLKRKKVIKLESVGQNAGAWIVPFGGTKKLKDGTRVSADKILVKSNGAATYLAKDIAYHLSEAKFGKIKQPILYKKILHPGLKDIYLWSSQGGKSPAPVGHSCKTITPIDTRQSYLQDVLRDSLAKLGYPEVAQNALHLAYEVVSLSPETARDLGAEVDETKTVVAMSGRAGIGVKADDLFSKIKEIVKAKGATNAAAALLARAAVRYQMLKITPQTLLVFDMNEATRATGDSGVYLCYAYARAMSILRRLGRGHKQRLNIPADIAPSEKALIKKIIAWPNVLTKASDNLDTALLARYSMELASAFTAFYEDKTLGPIRLESNRAKKRFRLALVKAFTHTLKDALSALGIEPPEKI